ncbi:MAG: M56/M15 family metallopeptidase [Ferruginibacter sp.]
MLLFAYYLLKVIICSAVLFGYYWFFLRNKVFHIYNRFYLLAIVVLSMLLPLVKFNLWHEAAASKSAMVHMLEIVNGSDEYLDEIVIQSHYNHIDKEQIILWLFVAVCICFALYLVKSILKINLLKRTNPVQKFEGIDLVNTYDKSTPFSFFKNIFWNNAIDINSNNGQRILKHELAHIQEKHSQDKLFINILMILFWCNPIFWLLRKELNLIHEFLADKKAVEDGDTAAFAAMILQTTYPSHRFELTNNFFYSPIKRRLAMLTKNNKTNYISRLLVLPLALIVFAAFTLKSKLLPATLSLKAETLTVVIDAGHGGTDNGAVAIDGTTEKDISLDLLKKIKALNQDDNIKLLFTRETDIYQTPKEKAELASKLGADLFISIHVDNEPKNKSPKGTGLGIWVSRNEFTNSESSKLLASALIASFLNNYAIPVPKNPMKRPKGIWILQATKCPAVLIEAGFISNEKDLAYLKSEAGQTQFAKNVLDAIENFAANKDGLKSTELSSDTDTVGMFVNVKNTDADYLKSDEFKSKALVIVDAKEIGNAGYDYIEKSKASYTSMVVYNPTEAKKNYGVKGYYGVIKVTLKDASFTKADSLFYDQKSKSIRLGGSNSPDIKGLENVLIYVDGKITTPLELNKIPPSRISSINILKGNKLDDITEAKGKAAIINVITKPDDLPEVKVVSKISATKGDKAISKYGDKGENAVVEIISKNDTIPQEDKVFTKVEEEPEFPGGKDAWREYLQKNLKANMPVDEGWKPGTYTIITQFIVDKEGNVSDISTKDFPGSKTAQMCIDLIKKGPKWMPAKQNNNIVKAYRKQPITFVVAED